MSKVTDKNIIFIPANQIVPDNRKINFVFNEKAERVLRKDYSDINELKSYLNPRGKKY